MNQSLNKFAGDCFVLVSASPDGTSVCFTARVANLATSERIRKFVKFSYPRRVCPIVREQNLLQNCPISIFDIFSVGNFILSESSIVNNMKSN